MSKKSKRQSIGALALITRKENGKRYWLAQWNGGWSAFNFIGGHREEDESFRECVEREALEELEIDASEMIISEKPFKHLEYSAFSKSAGVETNYVMELFDVELTEEGEKKAMKDNNNRWISEDEVRAEKCDDGKTVSVTMKKLLTMAGLLDE